MKEVIIFILLAIVGFLMWNGRRPSSYEMAKVSVAQNVSVPANVIQSILTAVQELKPDQVAIETLFVNLQADGSYVSRFMFFNTSSYSGIQYDVKSKLDPTGSKMEIIEISDSAKIDPNYGYKPDVYASYSTINTRPETLVQTNLSLGTRS